MWVPTSKHHEHYTNGQVSWLCCRKALRLITPSSRPNRRASLGKNILLSEAPQRCFSYRAILVAMVSQNSLVLDFVLYRTIIAAQNGVSHRCACVKLSTKEGVSHYFGGVPTSLKILLKYRAIWGIAILRDMGPLRSCLPCWKQKDHEKERQQTGAKPPRPSSHTSFPLQEATLLKPLYALCASGTSCTSMLASLFHHDDGRMPLHSKCLSQDFHFLLQGPRTLELIFKPREAQRIIDFDLSGTGDSQRADSRESIRANHSQLTPLFL